MTHEIEREDGTIQDVWDELPDATDADESYPTAGDLARWNDEGGGGIPLDHPDYAEAEIRWIPTDPTGQVAYGSAAEQDGGGS